MYGLKGQAGFAAASSWGATFVPATTMIPFVSESITKNFDRMMSKALIGQAGEHESEVGRQIVAGDLVMDLDYNNLGLLEYALGDLTTGTYSLTMDLPMFHLEIDKGVQRYRFQSCKVNQVTIAGSAGAEDPITVTLNVIAYSATISGSTFPSLSLSTPTRAWFEDLSMFRIGDLADALAPGDELGISSFELVCNHGLQADGKDSSNQANVLEPIRNEFRQVTAKFGLARNSSDAENIADLCAAGTRVQAQLALTNGSDSFTVYLPQGKVTVPPHMNVSGPGVISSEFETSWHYNNDNSNMSTREDQVEIVVS